MSSLEALNNQKKVDMSLDDIIKLSKAQKRNASKAKQTRGGGSFRGSSRGRGGRGVNGRGRGLNGRGRGLNGRGRGVGAQGSRISSHGRGRAQEAPNNNSNKQQLQSNSPRMKRGRGRGFRVNQNIRGRGRGQARGGAALNTKGTMVFNLKNTLNANQNQQRGSLSRQQRLNKVRQQAALLREKQKALKDLQRAQQNMLTVQQAIQQSARNSVVNMNRGIVTQGNQQAARGRRKLLTSLKFQTANTLSTAQTQRPPARQLVHTSVTISNPAAGKVGMATANRGKRRGWRKRPAASVGQESFTIQVANQNPRAKDPAQSAIMNQLKLLKPAVSTVYKFQKNVFATPSTGLSLNERFAATKSLAGSSPDQFSGERKVYM